MKNYKLTYFVKGDESNPIIIRWQQGLTNFKASYHDDVFFESPNIGKLKTGVSIFHEKLGNVFIKLCSHPIGFEVKVGDLYLENSRILAKEALVTVSAIWMFIGILSTVGSLSFLFLPGVFSDSFGLTIFGVLMTVSIFYIVSGTLIRKGHIWVYYVSLVMFACITLLYFVDLAVGNVIIICFRALIIGVVLRHFKNIQALFKHRKAVNKQKHLTNQEDLLDNI